MQARSKGHTATSVLLLYVREVEAARTGSKLHTNRLAKKVAGKRGGNTPVSSSGFLGGSDGVHPIPGLHPSVEGRGTPLM